MCELLEKRSSRPPSVLYSRSPSPTSRPQSGRSASRATLVTSCSPIQIVNSEISCQEASSDIHTDLFPLKDQDVLLRRGNTLVVKLYTSVEFTGSYNVSLVFTPVYRSRERFAEFRATGIAKTSCKLWLSVTIPTNFPVGKYHAHITLSLRGYLEVLTHFHRGTIIIIFNPWNSEDDSYIGCGSAEVDDYVLSSQGVIWRGNHRQKTAMYWDYGQYEEGSLESALFLLSPLTADECRTVATVTRCLISKVCDSDGTGVMKASWTGRYGSGVHPASWNGSATILQKFLHTRTPVKYAQCWVLAGVAVTLMRALGIAARPVTCYNMASCFGSTLSRYFTTEGDFVHGITSDIIWVYRVCVEAHMRRDDLPPGYDGWQLLDTIGSPRVGRVIGPVAPKAVCEKATSKQQQFPYLTSVAHTAISADIKYLRVKSHDVASVRKAGVALVERGTVGASIVTSSGNDKTSLIDLTWNYKKQQGDPQPTMTHKMGSFPLPSRDCSFSVSANDNASLGDTIQLAVSISNQGGMLRTIDGRVVGKVVQYNGTAVRNFFTMQFTGTISPGQDASVSLPIEGKKYMRHLVPQAMLQFFVCVQARENSQMFIRLHDFALTLPKLKVTCTPQKVTLGESARVRLDFKNPLTSSLTRIVFLVCGSGLCKQKELSYKKLLLPGKLATMEFPIRPYQLGDSQLLMKAYSIEDGIKSTRFVELINPNYFRTRGYDVDANYMYFLPVFHTIYGFFQ